MMRRLRFLAPACALILAGCGGAPDAAVSIDRPTGAAAADDPVLRAALRDPIMADPGLVQQANADAVRPPAYPRSGAVPPDDIATRAIAPDPGPLRTAPAASADCPQCRVARASLTLGALAENSGANRRCTDRIGYSAAWANRLPPAASLYPDARVIEAAGADAAGCAVRVVRFASAAPLQRLVDFYFTRATAAGYRAVHRADAAYHVVAGTKAGGGAVLVIVKARPEGGSAVDLLADGG